MLSRICDIADATADISWTAQRDGKLVNTFAKGHKRDLKKAESQLVVQRRRQEMLRGEPDSPWQTNMTALRQNTALCSRELTTVEDTVQRLKRELLEAEARQCTLSSKLKTYKEISVSAAARHRLLSIVTDLRLFVLETQKDRATSRIALMSSYKDFCSVVDKKMSEQFESELPSLVSRIMGQFISMNQHRDMAFEQLPPPSIDGQTTEPAGIESVNQGLRAGLEMLRLWRQLCLSFATGAMLEQIDSLETRLTNELHLSRKMASDMQKSGFFTSRPSESRGKYENSTVFLYFNHLFHDTPDGHMESKRRSDTVVEKILKREKLEKRSVAPDGKPAASDQQAQGAASDLPSTAAAAPAAAAAAEHANHVTTGPGLEAEGLNRINDLSSSPHISSSSSSNGDSVSVSSTEQEAEDASCTNNDEDSSGEVEDVTESRLQQDLPRPSEATKSAGDEGEKMENIPNFHNR
jgi:hypothetical protein